MPLLATDDIGNFVHGLNLDCLAGVGRLCVAVAYRRLQESSARIELLSSAWHSCLAVSSQEPIVVKNEISFVIINALYDVCHTVSRSALRGKKLVLQRSRKCLKAFFALLA